MKGCLMSKCSHVWFVSGLPAQKNGYMEFLGFRFICLKCDTQVSEKKAGEKRRFHKICEELDSKDG